MITTLNEMAISRMFVNYPNLSDLVDEYISQFSCEDRESCLICFESQSGKIGYFLRLNKLYEFFIKTKELQNVIVSAKRLKYTLDNIKKQKDKFITSYVFQKPFSEVVNYIDFVKSNYPAITRNYEKYLNKSDEFSELLISFLKSVSEFNKKYGEGVNETKKMMYVDNMIETPQKWFNIGYNGLDTQENNYYCVDKFFGNLLYSNKIPSDLKVYPEFKNYLFARMFPKISYSILEQTWIEDNVTVNMVCDTMVSKGFKGDERISSSYVMMNNVIADHLRTRVYYDNNEKAISMSISTF